MQFIFDWDEEDCVKCSKPLKVLATRKRQITSIAYGKFLAVERVGYCPDHPKCSPARSNKLSAIVASGCNIAYDVIVQIGLARFLECRQCEEIQQQLSRQHGIEVSVRTISQLSQKFVAYFQVVHQESIKLLSREMRDRGGYILHVDGTCEEGSRVLLVCLDSLSGQVLESRRISSENHDEIENILQGIRRDWGSPLAVVHDLRRSLITAAAEVFQATPQFVCHYHFVADVGKDILSPHVDRLRRLFRRTKVRSKLRALRRSLTKFASQDGGQSVLSSILGVTSTKSLREVCTSENIKGTVHALASWILAFSHSGDGYGFPFDIPYLTLYERILEAHKVLSETSATWSVKRRGPLSTLRRLKDILEVVVASDYTVELRTIVTQTKRDRAIFERLRSALRICPKGGSKRRNEDGTSSSLTSASHKRVLKNLRKSLMRKTRSGPSRNAAQIIVKHLDKYSDLLFGHVLRKRSKRLVVPRTNNVQESLFRTVKRQCRRLHGRGHLRRDIEDMLEATPLLLNLRLADYCEAVYGGREPHRIADRFSIVDPNAPSQVLEDWHRDKLSMRIPRKFESLINLPQRLGRFIRLAFRKLQHSK